MAKANPKLQWGAVANRANQAEKYLRWFVEFCPVPIAMFDYDLRYILVSQPWVKMLGIPRLKLIGTDIHDSLAITQAHQQGLERCLTGGQMHYSTEVEIVIRGNESQLFQWEVQPWYTDDGAAGGVIIASQPIADQISDRISEQAGDQPNNHHSSEILKRHLAEEVLERQHLEDAFNQIGTALESASDAVCIVDLVGNPIYINLAFNDLFGYDLSSLRKAINFRSLFVNPQIAAEIFTAVMQGDAWSGEIEMGDRHQQHIPIDLRVNPVKKSTGEVIGTTYICTNILDRKVAEEEINKSFAALGATLEATADSILVLDAIGHIIICNQKFVDLLCIPDRIFTSHDDSHILQYVVARILSSSHLHNFGKDLSDDQNTFEIVQLDDGRTLECYSQPQNSMQSCGGRVWSLRDITERLADEALVRASEEKYRLQAEKLENALDELKSAQSQLIQAEKMSGLGQLVAGIAHEINNPVNFIYGNLSYADTYTSELLNLIKLYGTHYPNPVEPIQERLKQIDIDFIGNDFLKLISSIRVGAERIQGIVRSLNNFSRSDEAKFKLVDIHDGIDSTLMILQSRLKATASRPKILVEKNYGDLPEIECYAGQLNQVFMNLLTNAIDALEEDALANGTWQMINNQPEWVRPDGKVSKISIQTETQTNSQNDKFLIIRVADNAGGIPEEFRNRLFDLFFTTKPVGKGTGLGLSIAYQIVTENHGGKLSFNSEIGKGSEFVIEIPLK
jgi:PAS domain S-box-containing protein